MENTDFWKQRLLKTYFSVVWVFVISMVNLNVSLGFRVIFCICEHILNKYLFACVRKYRTARTLVYLYTYIYYIVVKKLSSFLRKYSFPKTINWLLRKYVRSNTWLFPNTIICLLRKYTFFVWKYDCSKNINCLSRKYYILLKHMTFQRNLIICSANMIFRLEIWFVLRKWAPAWP